MINKNNTAVLLKDFIFNIFFLTIGSLIIAIGINSVILPNGFISGGVSGLSLFLYYLFSSIPVYVYYMLLNIPIFLISYFFISKEFFWYTIYGTISLSFFLKIIYLNIQISDPFLAVLAGGFLIGIGGGLTLYSKGSTGGVDIIAILLNKHFDISIGNFQVTFNAILFSVSLIYLNLELILYSLALSFCTGQVLDATLTKLNQRKSVIIISDSIDSIIEYIRYKLNKETFILNGKRNNFKKDQKILLTVVHNYQLKSLEKRVFKFDPDAIVIIENTFNVMGSVQQD